MVGAPEDWSKWAGAGNSRSRRQQKATGNKQLAAAFPEHVY